MATNAIHTLKIGSTEYPIYGEGFKIDTLGSLSEGDFYPILISDKWTRAQATPTAADDSKALVTKTVGDLSWHPFGRCLYVKNLQMGGIPESGNPGGTLRLYGYIDAVEEDGYGMSLGESNQVLASGGADNNVHWRTIDLVGGKDTIGLVKNGSSVNPDGDTWKPVAFKDGVPYYQEVKVDISNMPELDAVLDDLRNSIFTQGDGIEISGGDDGSAKTISVVKATNNALGGIKIGATTGHPVKLDTDGKAYIDTIDCKTPQSAVTRTDIAADGKVVTGVTINQNANGEITDVTVAETSLDDTYLKKTGGTVKGTINIENDSVTIVSNSTIESRGFRASDSVDIGGTDITGEGSNTFYIGDRAGNNHVIFGVDGNGVTTTEVHAANINANNITADTIVAKEIIGPYGPITSAPDNGSGDGVDLSSYLTKVEADGTYLTKDEADIKYVTLADEQTISGKKTFTNDVVVKTIDLCRENETQFLISKTMGFAMGSWENVLKYHHINGHSDDQAKASFAGGAAVFKYADQSSHLKTVYVDNLLQTPKLQSETGMIQSVSSSGKFTFKTGDTTPLEIGGASANFGVVVTSSMGFFDTSDERKKNFIRPIDVDLEKLSNLKKHYFTWKDGNGEMQIGTSAQEVKELYPELVNEAEDGTLSVAYNKLSVVALAAIDKLHNENTELKKKVKTLEERLAKIESLLESQLNEIV